MSEGFITACPRCRRAIRLPLGRLFKCKRPRCGATFGVWEVTPTLERFGLTQEIVNWLSRPCPATSEGIFWIPSLVVSLFLVGVAISSAQADGVASTLLCVTALIVVWLLTSWAYERAKQRTVRRHRRSIESSPYRQRWLEYVRATKEFSDFLAAVKHKEDEEIKAQKRKEHEALRASEQWWRSLDGWKFEKEFALFCERQGYSVDRRGGSRDGGIDLILHRGGRAILVQCKAHKKYIPPGIVRELYGTLVHNGANEAWLVSTYGFHKGSYEFVRGKPIRLLTIRDILRTAHP